MVQRLINIGTGPNTKDGDTTRNAFDKVNQNFTELYGLVGESIDGQIRTDIIGSVFADDSTVLVDAINQKIFIRELNVDGQTSVGGHIIPGTDNTYDLGSPTHQWRDIFVSNGSIYIGDLKLSNVGGQLVVQQVTNPGEETESPVPDSPGSVTTDRLVNGANTFVLKDDGTVELNGDPFTGGGTGGTVQPYLELTNSPFIVQPVVLGTPVSVSTPGDGSGAEVEVVIGEGPVITSITVTTPGTNYIVGQRYRVWFYQIGGNDNIDNIDFEVETVGDNGELLTVTNAAFVGAATNTPGTYSGQSLQYRASPGDIMDSGVTLVRGAAGALFNIEAELEYDDNSYVSPIGTEWNNDGWDNLVGVASRSYGTFYSALNGAVGNNIIGAELVMRDTINDKYYKFSFSNWGQNNGGSYSYTRTEITDPNFFKKADYATANNIDVIEDDSTLQIGITRGNNNGIYNPFTEIEWDENVSPAGTEWNVDGWSDLTDVETRTYTNFYAAYGNGGIGNKIPGSQAVMYVPSIDKYYAVQWLNWTQNNQGGGFSYLRYELDLTQLQQGITFADGTVLKSAEGIGRVKLTALGNRRIEEVAGFKSVSVSSRNRTEITGATYTSVTAYELRVKKTTEINAFISPYYNTGTTATWYISFNNVTFRAATINSDGGDNWMFYYVNANDPTLQVEDAPFYIRRDVGGDPVVWWDKNDLTGGSSNFRGATIDYHAYTGESTIIGTIHIVDDSGEEHISHTEAASGSSDGDNDDLWLVQNEGTISYRRIDGESKTLRIQWIAKVFYGSEFYD